MITKCKKTTTLCITLKERNIQRFV